MAEDDFSKNFNALLQMQNQYLDMWKNASQQHAPPKEAPLEEQINNFWSSMFAQSNASNPLFNPFSGNTNQQEQLMSQVTKCFETIVNASAGKEQQSPENWQAFLNKTLTDLQAQLMKMGNSPFNTTADATALWNGPLSFWQQTMQPQVFADLTQTTGGSTSTGPGLGPNREKYEKLKNLQDALSQYQKTQELFSENCSTFWSDVVDQFKTKIDNASDEEEFSSIQSLYNLWIDSAEKVYAKLSASEKYQKLHSKLINASMEVKKATDDLQEDTLSSLNIPSRKEIDTLSERLQKTRRENRILRKELDDLKAAFANIQKDTAKATSKSIKKKSIKKKSSKKKTAKK